MTAKRYLIVPLAATALATAACGSSSSSSATNAASATSTTSAKSKMHEKMPHSHSMMMSGHMHAMPAMAHAQVTLASSRYGKVLYDEHHLVLYVFSADHRSASTCYRACASAWPPMLTKGTPRVTGLNAGLLGTTKRKNGSLQVTYGGHPLYYWSGDKAGTIMCQHVQLHGGDWYVVNANGTANTAKGVGTMSAMS
jgi:predicted lipoprotein with Yx(FWY)xxD motif